MMAFTHYESDPRVIREAEAAVEAGFGVDFLALRKKGDAPTEMIRGVHLIRLNQAKYRGSTPVRYLVEYGEFFLRCLVKTTSLFLRRRFSAVHVNNMPDFLVFTTIIPKLFGAKIILDIHDPMPNTFVSKFKRIENGFYYHLLLWQERLSAAYCDQIITVHDPVKEGILVKHGLSPDSIKVIANFADDELFPLRKSFSIEGRIRFVYHGSILERSGLRMLITALTKVHRKDRISVKIIGEGDFSQELKRIIQSSNVGRTVNFDNHSYPAHSISARIEDCNVGIVPLEISSATNHALPLKLLEYISLGLPVVTVRNKAISHYFSLEDCIFFEPNDPDSLSAVLNRLIDNPEILLRYRERSLALRERFSWIGQKKEYVALLRRLTCFDQS